MKNGEKLIKLFVIDWPVPNRVFIPLLPGSAVRHNLGKHHGDHSDSQQNKIVRLTFVADKAFMNT